MFAGKKTEETEWTRFSKALSSRERDDADTSADLEPAPAAAQSRGEPSSPPTMSRPPSTDVNVTARTANRPASEGTDDDIESVIGEHTTIDGTFRSENSIRVRGTVQGEIESQRSILVEEQANVTAKVTGATVMIAGQINGQVYCDGRVEIKPTGRVIGEINAGKLIMQEGAFFEGQLKMGKGAAQTVSVS